MLHEKRLHFCGFGMIFFHPHIGHSYHQPARPKVRGVIYRLPVVRKVGSILKTKAVHKKNMCVCLANGKVSYLCRVAFATYILKGRFSDAHTDLAKSGKFYKSGYDKQKSVPPLWAWTAFSLSPDYGLPEPAKRDTETDTLFFCACWKQMGQPKNRESRQIQLIDNVMSRSDDYELDYMVTDDGKLVPEYVHTPTLGEEITGVTVGVVVKTLWDVIGDLF